MYYYTEDTILTNYNETLNKNIYKIEIEDIKEKIIKNLKCNLSILEKNNKQYLEIISNKCNTYIGLLEILKENNIKNNEILSIIGNESDITILNNISNTYIVENSIEKLNLKNIKKTSSNNDKGVEKILKCKIV
ncbi:MAG: HAD hydrolase family protein [Bacilli bacterium]|nr:HAD hydrolase family protein [Bacilli bacterium]